jgi:hypothetical protein
MGAKRTNTAVFVVLIGVLAAATGLFVSLYLVERKGAAEVGERATAVEREVSAAQAEARDNRSTKDAAVDAHAGLRAENDTLHACADPTKASIEAFLIDDDAAFSAAVDQMFLHCGR